MLQNDPKFQDFKFHFNGFEWLHNPAAVNKIGISVSGEWSLSQNQAKPSFWRRGEEREIVKGWFSNIKMKLQTDDKSFFIYQKNFLFLQIILCHKHYRFYNYSTSFKNHFKTKTVRWTLSLNELLAQRVLLPVTLPAAGLRSVTR